MGSTRIGWKPGWACARIGWKPEWEGVLIGWKPAMSLVDMYTLSPSTLTDASNFGIL